MERALENSKSRITFVKENIINPRKAHIYSFRIPEELRSQADSHRFILEVSLAYKAKLGEQRKGCIPTFSTWVDWISGNLEKVKRSLKKKKLLIMLVLKLRSLRKRETPSNN